MLRWLLAALHLLALGIGLGAVWSRARSLRQPLDSPGLRRVLAADAWWGIAALLWISTGLWRWLGGLEKGTAYYLQNHVFWTKMLLLAVILALEVGPIITLAAGGVTSRPAAPRRGPGGGARADQCRSGRSGDPHGTGRHGHGAGLRSAGAVTGLSSACSRAQAWWSPCLRRLSWPRSAPHPGLRGRGRDGLRVPNMPVPRLRVAGLRPDASRRAQKEVPRDHPIQVLPSGLGGDRGQCPP